MPKKVGVLCYSLMPATVDLLNRVAEQLPDVQLKAFPLVNKDVTELDIRFPYRPTSFPGRYVNVNGEIPEGHLLSLQLSVVKDLVSSSDLVVFLGIQAAPAMLSALLARGLRKPVLIISQTMPPEYEEKRRAILRITKKLTLRMATAHVAQTPVTTRTLTQVYGIPEKMITYAPFDSGGQLFRQKVDNTTVDIKKVRTQFGISEEAVVFLFVGTLIYLKGVDVLVDAFSDPSFEHCYLWLVGPDGGANGQLKSLQTQVSNLALDARVRFLGPRFSPELIAIYRSSDVFVLPSRKDVWPKVLTEAALIGLPLIATSVSGAAHELVRDGINGFVVAPGDVDGLRNAMKSLKDRELRRKMGQKSQQIVQEYVNPEFEAAEIAGAIRRCL